MVRNDEIREILDGARRPLEACKTLTERANQAGGHDNITVIVAQFDGEGLPPPAGEPVPYQPFDPGPGEGDPAEEAAPPAAVLSSDSDDAAGAQRDRSGLHGDHDSAGRAGRRRGSGSGRPAARLAGGGAADRERAAASGLSAARPRGTDHHGPAPVHAPSCHRRAPRGTRLTDGPGDPGRDPGRAGARGRCRRALCLAPSPDWQVRACSSLDPGPAGRGVGDLNAGASAGRSRPGGGTGERTGARTGGSGPPARGAGFGTGAWRVTCRDMQMIRRCPASPDDGSIEDEL